MMKPTINIYCDESCHLQNDKEPVMVIGAVYCPIEKKEEIYYFVNLRCSKIFQNKIVAFAGGGITPKSNPEKEWQETELKSQAILNHLKFHS